MSGKDENVSDESSRYRIVCAYEVYELEQEVNAALGDGWQLQGGVSITCGETEDHNGYVERWTKYVQALIRRESFKEETP